MILNHFVSEEPLKIYAGLRTLAKTNSLGGCGSGQNTTFRQLKRPLVSCQWICKVVLALEPTGTIQRERKGWSALKMTSENSVFFFKCMYKAVNQPGL